MIRKLWWIGCLVCLAVVARAQDPQFSQFYSAPMYLNPAFAGNTIQSRMVANYRLQWPSIPGRFVSYAASYDHNLAEINSGVALAIQHDKAGSAGLRYTNFAGMYAYNIRISRTFALRTGVSMSYTLRDLNFSELVFGDQLINSTPTTASGALNNAEQTSYPDISTGAVLYTRRFWGGISAHHINRPNQSLVGGETSLPIRWSVHAGLNVPTAKSRGRKIAPSFTFAFNYKAQAEWDQLDLVAYFTYRTVTFGLWYRGLPIKSNDSDQFNHDALIVLLGYKFNDLRIGYTYDLTLSDLLANTGGAHELSLVYEFASPQNKRKRRRQRFVIPCAKF
ncbi:MAG: type IX secretion system membrane protein PorP/SprF [Bacteroidota bacterium]